MGWRQDAETNFESSEWGWSKYFSRSRLKNNRQGQNEKYQFVEHQGSLRFIWQNTGYHATWGENPCCCSGGVARGSGKGTGLLWRLPRAPGDERAMSLKSLKVYLLRRRLRLRGLMLTRELGTAGSTVVWARELGTVRVWFLFILTSSCCVSASIKKYQQWYGQAGLEQ